MDAHFQAIYARQAATYQRLIEREDHSGNLFSALHELAPPDGAVVVEMGAGTGRLTRWLARSARRVLAVDASGHMLGEAVRGLGAAGLAGWNPVIADNRCLPVPDGIADLCIEGWSFGHLVGDDGDLSDAARAVDEMLRVLRPGGTAVVVETLGTGCETPQPPTAGLADFYACLEREHGFASRWIRTDYRFASPAEAIELTRFFFGDSLADRVARSQQMLLPECTGIWWRAR